MTTLQDPVRATSVNRTFGFVFGSAFLLAALLGFILLGPGPLVSDGVRLLGLFEVNVLHSLVHLVLAVVLLLGALRSRTAARWANLSSGAAYLAVGVIGVVLGGEGALALNLPDHLLHFSAGLALVAAALVPLPRRKL